MINIFAYTEVERHPPNYISLNVVDGKNVLTCRQGTMITSVEIPGKELQRLSEDLSTYLKKRV